MLSSNRPSLTDKDTFFPSLSTFTDTCLPTGLSPTILTSSLVSFIVLPSNSIITSPDFIPPVLAGPSGTSVTKAPSVFSIPRASATSSVTSCILTPNQPLLVSPKVVSWSITFSTTADDIEKPIPIDPPFGERIAVLTPMTSPSMLKSGPPEFPLFIAASVCMKSS